MSPSRVVLILRIGSEQHSAETAFLRQAGFEVREVDSVSERIQARDVGVVIIDGNLVGHDIASLCRSIKDNPAACDIGILQLCEPTAEYEGYESFEDPENHPDCYLTRPFPRRHLLAAVHSLIRRTTALRAAIDKIHQEGGRVEPEGEAISLSEGQLVESERSHRLAFERHPHPMWVYDLETLAFLAVNDAAIRNYGYSREEFRRMTIADIRPPEDVAGLCADILTAPAHEPRSSGPWRHRKKDGSVFQVEVTSDELPFQRRMARIVVAIDITGRLTAESSLLAKSEELDRYFRFSRDLLCIAGADGRFQRLNAEWEKVLGYKCSALEGTPFLDLVHADDIAATRQAMAVLLNEEPIESFTNRYKRNDGSYCWLEWRASQSDGVIYAVARDVTDRRASDEQLRKLSRIVEQSPESIMITDRDGNIEYVNPQFLVGTGYEEAEVIGQNPRILQSGKMSTDVYREMWETITQGREWHGELLNKKKNGELFWERAILSPIRDTQGAITHYVGIKRDITPYRDLEERLRQSQRLESIGKLAGGVAHDFNNHLTVINGYCDILVERWPVGDPTREQIEEIRKAGGRAAAVTQHLLAFSRRQVLEPRSINLNDLVRDTEKALLRLLRDDIEMRLLLDPDLGPVMADSARLNQVLLNLAINARDAMPDGGRLVVETQNVELDASFQQQHPEVKPGPYAVLIVTDSGIGMDEKTKSRIFEPFFTTKDPGEGTGLGLSTTYGIVRQMGGWIWVYSEPGRGSTFKIYFPRTDIPAQALRMDQEATPELSASGTETILLVEDHEEVRKLSASVLRHHGYRVLEACSGSEALFLSEELPEPIDLLITDVIMPGMNGRELASRLQASRHPLRVLYTSGYGANVIVHQGILDVGVEYLAKPFSPLQLAKRVRQVLSRPRPGRRILVIDDDTAVRTYLRQFLIGAGYTVLEAENGKLGCRLARENQFDLVVTDVIMPEKDGIETIRQLRSESKDLKIIAISGAVEGPFLRTAQLLGADACLQKPVIGEHLLDQIRKVCTAAR